ncbi:MAG: tetratricopeptide repeat protein [Luteitalea sp.]|nr:tetratricopeptide repeat protein [Luteitalea sp.]
MKSESIAFGIAGVVFGLIAGWIIGSQQTAIRQPSTPSAQAAPASASGSTPTAALLDENKVKAFLSVADREPSNPKPRAALANLYFDAERYDDAIKWYGEALKLAPDDINVSTDLGISFFYLNQPDRALDQFTHSLKLDPKHTKTLLNLGIVRAYGKQDLAGAEQAWGQVVQIAPDSPEGQQAKRALDALKSAHPPAGSAARPGA